MVRDLVNLKGGNKCPDPLFSKTHKPAAVLIVQLIQLENSLEVCPLVAEWVRAGDVAGATDNDDYHRR